MAHDKKVKAFRYESCWLLVNPMADITQNKLSHRYQALCKFQEWLAKGEN
jgi:inosine/xanthosine triphosphate pyrophosphatase family protein